MDWPVAAQRQLPSLPKSVPDVHHMATLKSSGERWSNRRWSFSALVSMDTSCKPFAWQWAPALNQSVWNSDVTFDFVVFVNTKDDTYEDEDEAIAAET